MSQVAHWALFVPLLGALYSFAACLQKRRGKRRDGWTYLTPGPLIWISLFSGLVLSLVFTLFVAAGRGDTSTAYVGGFFVLLTMWLAYQTSVEEVRWNEQWLERRTVFLEWRKLSWNELANFGEEVGGYYWVSSYDGPRLRLSPYDNGIDQLLAMIARNLPKDGPPPEFVVTPSVALAKATATGLSPSFSTRVRAAQGGSVT